MIALIEALPADRYWQSLHQQARVAIGGWSDWKRTAPQKHRPVMSSTILNTPSCAVEASSNYPSGDDNLFRRAPSGSSVEAPIPMLRGPRVAALAAAPICCALR